MTSKKVTVDRIDEGVAILILEGEENSRVTLPVTHLPPETREGDVLTLTLERDPYATQAALDRSAALIARLRQP